MEGVERGTVAWIRRTAFIHRAQDDLDRVAGSGSFAAAVYMDDLGRTCRGFADCLDE
ncbi:DUF6415 family natural product biosynthesis protein [Streptomyces mobaraensis]|uniref:DUF6415 family natural product biosynthesis protein n=1 Tax=Streptomyces mobaraensis TaxID=35621 RepID=UPI0012ACE62D|nr:DUF6415 family natural product biosynthesis protein [Streptomyces mobaraensis]